METLIYAIFPKQFSLNITRQNKKRENQPMKENKKLETTNTEIVAQTPLTQITDNRREITELTDAEIKEIEKELEQYDKDSWQYSKYLEKFKHIGGEIPKDVPFTEYFGYIHQNFRNTKPRKEWIARDYKVEAAKRARLRVAFTIRDHGYKEPLTDRQKRVVEQVRNGTDFHIYNSLEKLCRSFYKY